MKKLFFIILLFLSYHTYAEDTFRFNFNIANIGAGLSYFSEFDYNSEIFVELLHAGIEHKITNIGMGFSPLKYWNFSFNNELDLDKDNQKWSFLNFNINWDILDNKEFFLGPFCSVNYIFCENTKMKWDDYIFACGMRFSWSFNIFKENILYHFMSAEVGYRSINGANKFHFNMTIDLITFLYSIAYYGGGYGLVNNKNRE